VFRLSLLTQLLLVSSRSTRSPDTCPFLEDQWSWEIVGWQLAETLICFPILAMPPHYRSLSNEIWRSWLNLCLISRLKIELICLLVFQAWHGLLWFIVNYARAYWAFKRFVEPSRLLLTYKDLLDLHLSISWKMMTCIWNPNQNMWSFFKKANKMVQSR